METKTKPSLEELEATMQKAETGSFEFHKFEKDGDKLTGFFLGALPDAQYCTVTSDKVKPFVREGITGLVFIDYTTEQALIVGDYWDIGQFLNKQAESKVDFNNRVYKITRIKKAGVAQTDSVSFRVDFTDLK